ncbi:putative glutathione S-transferase [Polyplosphaeria fusca]|uniref:Glutathione S-transferase n=1 Tax=Polyplosphaeria fusca TaxID=682080 RepID=A0A9P4UU42_9PLEO|nr:putative glutathione S-transferase [Polyplosphaeria fusca]
MATPSSHPQLILYRGWDEKRKYVWSPFTTKLEFRLRTSHTPYTCAIGSTSSGPKGKIPYLELSSPSSDPQCLADSTLILKALSSRGLVRDLNARLSEKGKGVDLAVRAMMEDRLYFFHTHERWVRNYYAMRDYALGSIAYPVRVVVGLLAYRANVKKLFDQGTARFSDKEMLDFRSEIWGAVEGLLEESRRAVVERQKNGGVEGECWWVLGGEEPTEADATVYGFVVSVLVCGACPESGALLRGKFGGVVKWAEQVHRRWFADYNMWE